MPASSRLRLQRRRTVLACFLVGAIGLAIESTLTDHEGRDSVGELIVGSSFFVLVLVLLTSRRSLSTEKRTLSAEWRRTTVGLAAVTAGELLVGVALLPVAVGLGHATYAGWLGRALGAVLLGGGLGACLAFVVFFFGLPVLFLYRYAAPARRGDPQSRLFVVDSLSYLVGFATGIALSAVIDTDDPHNRTEVATALVATVVGHRELTTAAGQALVWAGRAGLVILAGLIVIQLVLLQRYPTVRRLWSAPRGADQAAT